VHWYYQNYLLCPLHLPLFIISTPSLLIPLPKFHSDLASSLSVVFSQEEVEKKILWSSGSKPNECPQFMKVVCLENCFVNLIERRRDRERRRICENCVN
jgi:hypothetical protein